ncbi:hypothetical protein ACFLQN_03570 [Candidatus Aenigmatarchaeota archaeon]
MANPIGKAISTLARDREGQYALVTNACSTGASAVGSAFYETLGEAPWTTYGSGAGGVIVVAGGLTYSMGAERELRELEEQGKKPHACERIGTKIMKYASVSPILTGPLSIATDPSSDPSSRGNALWTVFVPAVGVTIGYATKVFGRIRREQAEARAIEEKIRRISGTSDVVLRHDLKTKMDELPRGDLVDIAAKYFTGEDMDYLDRGRRQ